MKQHRTPARRAAWLFLAAPAFVAIPAHAQDATTPEVTPPPPVVRTVPQAQTPTVPDTATTPATNPARTATPSTVRGADPNSTTPVAPGAADVVDDARIAAQSERRAEARRPAARAATVARTAAPAAAAPVAATTSTPAATPAAPAETSTAVAAQPATPATTETAATTTETTTTQTSKDNGAPLWPLAVIAALIVAGGAFFLMRRRKADAYEEAVYYEEPATTVVEEPAPVAAAPVAAVAPVAAPVAAAVAMSPNHDELVAAGLSDDATVTDAPAEDVAALTEGAPAVRDRPWLELAMRPVRAGTSADEAMVEIELTVANSGTVKAEDVRVSTFMLTDTHASEMENMLVDAPVDAAIDPVTIEPGEGARIDATLAALKSDLGAEGRFTPVVVADARYRLPDGSEGRTAASFVVGVSDDDGGTLMPIDLSDRVMRDDVEARLHGEPEHA